MLKDVSVDRHGREAPSEVARLFLPLTPEHDAPGPLSRTGPLARRLRPVAYSAAVVLVAAGFRWGLLPPDGDATPAPAVAAHDIAGLLETSVERDSQVTYWLETLSHEYGRHFEEDLSRGTSYAWLISRELSRHGLPEALAVLPLIESQYLTRARSRTNAVGLWQLMPETARSYGLRLDEWVDERRDPVRSTRVAVQYLADLRQRFHSWPLVFAAYNGGPTRLADLLRGQGIDESSRYEEVLRRLPPETRHYVPKAIAASMISASPASYGLRREAMAPYRFDTVLVPGGTRLTAVAASIDRSVRTLRWLNPHLLQGVTPPGEHYALRVPVGSSPAVVAHFEAFRGRTYLADD